MVTAAELAQRIETDLGILQAETASLPEVEADWGQEPDVGQDVYYLEWRNLMAVLESLNCDYRSGAMSLGQRARYRALLGQLRAALPIVDRLELNRPTVPLDE